MGWRPAGVQYSVSTWRQPLPEYASPERAALLEQIAEFVVGLSDDRLLVAIDGLTAAGKSTFGDELGERVSRAGRPVLRACLDDFKRPWSEHHLYDRVTGEGYYRNAFDYAMVIDVLLEPCAPGGSGKCVLCSIDPLTDTDHSGVTTEAAADAVLVVDGVFAFRPEIDDHWDLRIWLDVDEATSVRRGGERDTDWAGTDAERIHRERYLPAERIYIAEVDPVRVADLVIDNSDFGKPSVIRARDGAW